MGTLAMAVGTNHVALGDFLHQVLQGKPHLIASTTKSDLFLLPADDRNPSHTRGTEFRNPHKVFLWLVG
jgi:hypothetical protein